MGNTGNQFNTIQASLLKCIFSLSSFVICINSVESVFRKSARLESRHGTSYSTATVHLHDSLLHWLQSNCLWSSGPNVPPRGHGLLWARSATDSVYLKRQKKLSDLNHAQSKLSCNEPAIIVTAVLKWYYPGDVFISPGRKLLQL